MDPVLFLHNADVHRRFCFSNQLFFLHFGLAQMEQSSNFLGNVERMLYKLIVIILENYNRNKQ